MYNKTRVGELCNGPWDAVFGYFMSILSWSGRWSRHGAECKRVAECNTKNRGTEKYVSQTWICLLLWFISRADVCLMFVGSVPATHSGEGIFSHESVDPDLFHQGCIIYHSKQGSRIPIVRWPIKSWFNMHQDVPRRVVSLLKMSCVNSVHRATVGAEIQRLVWRPWP